MPFSYKEYEESDAVKKLKQQAEEHSTYKESDAVTTARNDLNTHTANKVADWTGGTYGDALKQALDKINNREKFTYDLNGDALYQQYKDQYINLGRLAMQDTLGQASALTGGYGNSYASTAGNQAYQGYLQKLNDVVPELYQLAADRYDQEGQDLYNQYSLYNDAYNTEYNQYRDKVTDWNNEYDRLSDRYYNESNMDYNRFADDRSYYSDAYNNERTFDYSLYSDAYNRALTEYQQALSEAKSSGGGGGGGGSSYSSDPDPDPYTGTYIEQINKYVAGSSLSNPSSYSKATSAVKSDYKNGTISAAEQKQALDLLKKARQSGDLR